MESNLINLDNPKKVLVLTTTFPRWTGDSTPAFVYDLSKELRKCGMSVIVLAPHQAGIKRYEVMEDIIVYRFPYFYPMKYQKLAYNGGFLSNLKKSNLAKLQIPFLFVAELIYAFYIARREEVDVIHSHWILPSGMVGGLLKFFLGKRHILTEHAAGLAGLERIPAKGPICRFIVRNSDGITVVSRHVQKRLSNIIYQNENKYIKKIPLIKIIPMGVDVKSFELNKDKYKLKLKYNISSQRILIFIGRLAEKKGLPYLISAMPSVVSVHPDVMLIVCGDGPYRNMATDLVSEKNVNANVRFTGYISEEEKSDLLSLSDVLIVPSIVTDSGDTEGLPVVILEGLASRKAIIASDVGGIRDVIRDGYNGLLVEQRNSDQLADRIIKILSDDQLRESISIAAFDTAKEYDWNIIGKRYFEFLV